MGFLCTTPQTGSVVILSLALLIVAFVAKIIYLDIFEQELRRVIEGISNPSPQPEDPGRALDPGLEEDPDITVELVNGTFYQASCDGASVAITADYPGLLPISRVSQAKNPILRRGFLLMPCLTPEVLCFFAETTVGARSRAPRDPSAKAVRTRQA